jgi:hypothetical protein
MQPSNFIVGAAGIQILPDVRQFQTRRKNNSNNYRDFSGAVQESEAQREVLYVITSTHMAKERLQDQLRMPERLAFLPDPRREGHPDHVLYSQIHRGVHGLGGEFAANAEKVSLGLLLVARNAGWNAVTEVRASHPVSERGAAERLFLMRDEDADPVKNRLGMLSMDLLRSDRQELLQQLSAPINTPTATTITGDAQRQTT